MSAFETKFAKVAFPTCAADTTGILGTHREAVSGAGSRAIPVTCRGKYLKVTAIGCDLQVATSSGTSGQTLVADQAAVWGTGHVAAGTTVFNGSSEEGLIKGDATFLNWVPVSGTGFIEYTISERVGA